MTASQSATPPAGLPPRLIAGVLGAFVVVAGAYGAFISAGKAWAFFGFELVTVVAGFGAIAFAAGKLRRAEEMALACVAGTLFVAGVLGYVPIRQGLEGLPLKPLLWAGSRVGVAALLAALAVVMSMSHKPAAARTLLRALLWGIPLVGIAAWYKFAGLAPMTGGQSGFLEVLRVLGVFVVAVVSGVSLCATIHLAIRAFEIAFPDTSDA